MVCYVGAVMFTSSNRQSRTKRPPPTSTTRKQHRPGGVDGQYGCHVILQHIIQQRPMLAGADNTNVQPKEHTPWSQYLIPLQIHSHIHTYATFSSTDRGEYMHWNNHNQQKTKKPQEQAQPIRFKHERPTLKMFNQERNYSLVCFGHSVR